MSHLLSFNTMKLPNLMVILLHFVLFSVTSTTDVSTYHDTNMTNNDTSSLSPRTNDELNDMYLSWLLKQGKIYLTQEEKEKRFQIFKDNLNYIEQHNSGNHSYKLGLNKFADMSVDEYRLLYTKAKKTDSRRKLNNIRSDRYSLRSGNALPDFVDWRTKGAVAAVKDQGSCGSCWAFSTTGTVEAINQIITGDLITLSEQNLLDCDTSFNQGCSGGDMDSAFEYIVKSGGIDSDYDYPYTGTNETCNTKKNAKAVSIDGYVDVPENDESALQKAAANQPVSVTIAAGSWDFQLYDSGIFNGQCGTYLDHAVVVVGFGAEEGQDYWIVRNSWGAEWGEEGYMRIERNINEKEGKCGIAMAASYPIKNGVDPPKRATILVPFMFIFLLNFLMSQ